MIRNYFSLCVVAILTVNTAYAQNSLPDTAQHYTLSECIRYALKSQPAVKQAKIDQAIARTNNRIALSSGLPQVGLNATFTKYLQLPTAFVVNTQNPGGDKIKTTTGTNYTTIPTFSASQALFNNDVFSAIRTAPLLNEQARENAELTRINVTVTVSNAFYDVLLSKAQIVVLTEDTARLAKNLRDAYSQYVAGIVDKVDYKRASISLNNSIADLKNAAESIDAKTAILKREMGYPAELSLDPVAGDTTEMMEGISIDTTEDLQYTHRIEYQQLYTTQQIQRETTRYYRTAFLPTVSAFYNYVPAFISDDFSDLFSTTYPNSLFGVNLSLPIFQGFKRLENIHKSKLQQDRLHWDEVSLQLRIYAEYKTALADYKSNLNSYTATKANVQMAREVYDVIKLQYREGIKQYLEVITAESDLRSSEINYLNALYKLLQAKVSLQKALGDIHSDI